jgi:hypothetical protein
MSQNPFSTDFPIGHLSGQCAACCQPLQPGQVYYAVIWQQDEQYIRKDFDEKCWTAPPPDALGAWRAKVPVSQARPRPKHVPARLLMDVFERLGETDGAAPAKMRFVLALLLMRRRLLRDGGLREEAGVQTWHMKRPADQVEFDVVCPPLSEQDTEELSQQMMDLLSGLDEQAEAIE